MFIPIPKKGNAKECSNYRTVVLISHTSKVMLKILQARLQQYMKHEFPDVQAGFRKGKGTRKQMGLIHCIIKKAREFQKNIYFCFIDYTKPLAVWITTNWNHLTCLLRNLYAGQEATLEPNVEQQTGSKLGKEYVKAVYCHPVYLTYMQST